MASVAPMCARRNASRNETAVEPQLRKKATFFSTKVKTAVIPAVLSARISAAGHKSEFSTCYSSA